MDFSRGRTAGSTLSRRRPRIALLLIALVLIPGSALGFEVRANLDRIDSDRIAAEQIIELSTQRLAAIQLEAAIADERNWAVVVLGVEDFNVDNAVVTEILGLDIEETYVQSRATVDSLLTRYGPELTALVEEARGSQDTVEAVASGYGGAEQWARAVGEAAATRLNRIAARTPNGDVISDRLAYVDSAAAVARALTGEHTNYFGSRYFVGRSDPQRQLRELVSDRRDFISATEALLNSPTDSPALEAELAEMLA
ncbi:MAG: hypothetical protein HKN26_05665, partial [Acidimicrobiales bacterium]|nr:hypothetical protein [Acidimicrobiales bacterium]